MGHVIISGAGPAGAVLGYALAERGTDVTLLERHRDFAREFRGEDLAPMGLAVLRELGLGDEVDALPQREIASTDVYRNKRWRFSVPWTSPTPGLESSRFIPQPALLEMLTSEAAKRFPNFTLRRGVTVREPLLVNERVAGVRIESEQGSETLFADLVVGCDGRTSVLRRKSGLDTRRHGYQESFDVVWVRTGPLDNGRGPGLCRLFLANGRVMLVLPTPTGQLQLGNIIDKGSFGDIRSLGMPQWIDYISEFVSDDIVNSLRARQDELKPSLLDVQCFSLARWSRPGLLLIGDAAHPMSPAGGQGLAQALRDSVAACNEVAPLLARESTDLSGLDEAIRRVQLRREPEIIQVQHQQKMVPLVLFQRTWYSNLIFGVLGPVAGKIAPSLLSKVLDGATSPFRKGPDGLRLRPANGTDPSHVGQVT